MKSLEIYTIASTCGQLNSRMLLEVSDYFLGRVSPRNWTTAKRGAFTPRIETDSTMARVEVYIDIAMVILVSCHA